MAGELKSFQTPFTKAGDDLLGFFGGKVFDSQGSEMGMRWKPLAPSTLAARAKMSGYYANPPVERNKILVWTGRLRKGFRKAVSRTRLVIDNPDKKFAWNQSSRPMMGINKRVITIVIDKMEQYIRSLVSR